MMRILSVIAFAGFSLLVSTQPAAAQAGVRTTADSPGNSDLGSTNHRPDLAISLGDLELHDGLLQVRVHNIGNTISPRTKVALVAAGRTIAVAPLPEIKASEDRADRFAVVLLPVPPSVDLNHCSVVVDPAGILSELTVTNNRIDLKDRTGMSNTHRPSAINDSSSSHMKPRPEHIAFNVKDPATIAQWYVKHLGMKIYRKSPPPSNTHFVGDSSGHMMLELTYNSTVPTLDYPTFSHMSMHLAFSVDNVKAMRDSLLAAGAAMVEDVTSTPSGDQVLMMRDPWGLAIQFVTRVTPMLTPSGVRFEHFALNVPDPQGMVNWYFENMGMKVMRKGGPPNYGSFVGDAGGNMMLELGINTAYPILDLSKIDHLALHFAFVVQDVRAIRAALIAAGATMAEELRETNSGDQVLVLRDPWGLAIQFIKRGEPMLK